MSMVYLLITVSIIKGPFLDFYVRMVNVPTLDINGFGFSLDARNTITTVVSWHLILQKCPTAYPLVGPRSDYQRMARISYVWWRGFLKVTASAGQFAPILITLTLFYLVRYVEDRVKEVFEELC